MAKVGDLIEIRREPSDWASYVYKTVEEVGTYFHATFPVRCDDVFMIIGRQSSRKGKRMLNASNKRHVLQIVRLKDNQVYWVEPKHVKVIQRLENE